MPQGPLNALNFVQKIAGAFSYKPGLLDASQLLMTTVGGLTPVYDVAAAAVIKGTPGRIAKITVQTVPSAGNLTVNDCTTTGAAAIGNQILNLAFGSLTAGQVITLDWPCAAGITLSAVGTGGVYAVSYT